MISSPKTQRRIVIPRWRSLASTVKSQELGEGLQNARSIAGLPLEAEFVRRLQDWRKGPNVVTAARVVETALITHRESEARNQARLLTRIEAQVSPSVKKQASFLLQRLDGTTGSTLSPENQARQAISKWRTRTRLNPTDSLAWVELALGHAISRNIPQALRSMNVALQLAPQNRHVLRSAARLFLHAGDGEKAHDLIRRNASTPTDPWLMAAEIAFAQKLNRTPQFMKRGIALLNEKRFLARQTTELSSAVATAFLLEGNRKRSKRHFLDSTADPTGNSLAQAEWAAPAFSENIVPPMHLLGYDASEARAMHSFSRGEFHQSFEFSKLWIGEEPYSSRAYLAAAMAAGVLDEFTTAIEFAKKGLEFDPQSTHLRNHLAFCLASSGDLIGAERELKEISFGSGSKVPSLIAQANLGLISFRRGDIENAQTYYAKAIAGFKALGETRLFKSAQAYYAREAVLARLPEAADILSQAKENISTLGGPVAIRIAQTAEELFAQQSRV